MSIVDANNVVKIKDIGQYEGQTVTINGWLHNRRSSNKLHFIIVRDGTGFVQAVMSKAVVEDPAFANADQLSQETSLSITGKVRADTRACGGYEINVDEYIEVHGESHDYPITPKEHGIDFLMDRRHLWIRSERQTSILRIRHEIINAVRDFFNGRDFILCDAPILQPVVDKEASLFTTQYFDDTTAALGMSAQLYNEANAMALGQVYSIGPRFQAEKSRTRRHLTEFWAAEPEMAYADLGDAINLAVGLVRDVVARVMDKRKNELRSIDRDVKPLEAAMNGSFPRLTYVEAGQVLQKKGMPFEDGSDFSGTDQTVLSEEFSNPLVITHYPAGIKPFNIQPDGGGHSLSMELFAPEGYGSIITGGERINNLDLLIEQMEERRISREALAWYADLCQYGSVQRSGFSLHIERLVAWICRLEHVRETIPYPRMVYRLYP